MNKEYIQTLINTNATDKHLKCLCENNVDNLVYAVDKYETFHMEKLGMTWKMFKPR